uniref:U-box domain-containing protein n=1 Tax=Alexandrium catenella TaxID=2925 RepID=A0A7S1PL75_ALECA
MKPLASEWLLRGLRQALLPQSLAALLVLAGNCGGLEGPALLQAQASVVGRLQEQADSEILRGHAVTCAGMEALAGLGLSVPVDVPDGVLEADLDNDLGPGDLDDEWYATGFMPWLAGDEESEMTGIPEGLGSVCKECRRISVEGMAGEDYFAGFWYCKQCWDSWSEVMPGRVCLSPWPAEGGGVDAAEQCGAAALLLRLPAHLRCGIGGGLITEVPVRIPGSAQAAVPVAFRRLLLERWIRRSGGHCPLTLQPLDLRSAEEAPDVREAVRAWLMENGCGPR